MDTSNTSFTHPNFQVYSESNAPTEIAGSQPQGASSQGTGLGVLVLPKGEVMTILPSAPSLQPIVMPASSELANQAFAPTNVRIIPPVIVQQPKDSLSFDGAIVNEIKTLKAEWREQSRQFQENEDAESRKKKKKYKPSKSKKGASLKLTAKAQVHFANEKKQVTSKLNGFGKKKTKKTIPKQHEESIFDHLTS